MDIRSVAKKISPKNAVDILFIGIVVTMGLFLDWKVTEIVVFSLFIWIILNPISSRYLAAVAIFFLILTPISLVSGKIIIADQLAVHAYYFLIMTVMMGVYELRKEGGQDKQEEN